MKILLAESGECARERSDRAMSLSLGAMVEGLEGCSLDCGEHYSGENNF